MMAELLELKAKLAAQDQEKGDSSEKKEESSEKKEEE